MSYDQTLNDGFHAAMNPEGASVAKTALTRLKLGHHTFAHAKNRGEFVIKASGVALGAAMTAFGLDHSLEGMREESRPHLSHEGINIGHILSGVFCAGVGTGIAFLSYTKPLGAKSEALMEAVIEASKGVAR